jgi:hypothetical protein
MRRPTVLILSLQLVFSANNLAEYLTGGGGGSVQFDFLVLASLCQLPFILKISFAFSQNKLL